jgi:hypothetical protein
MITSNVAVHIHTEKEDAAVVAIQQRLYELSLSLTECSHVLDRVSAEVDRRVLAMSSQAAFSPK